MSPISTLIRVVARAQAGQGAKKRLINLTGDICRTLKSGLGLSPCHARVCVLKAKASCLCMARSLHGIAFFYSSIVQSPRPNHGAYTSM